jgi:hypothetical protein
VPTEIQALIDEGKYAEALRRLLDLTAPRTVSIQASYSGFTDGGVYDSGGGYGRPDDEDRAGGLPAEGSIPVVGGTAWWQSLMGIGPSASGSGSPSGPSEKRKRFDAEFEKQRRRYTLGDITPVEYLQILRAMKREYGWPRLSDPGFALQQEIDRAADDVAEANAANAANVKDPGDPVGDAFAQAEADQAAIEARQARRDARNEYMALATDPETAGGDQQAAAEDRWAQAIYDDLKAQAARRGIADSTVAWARFMRPRLRAAAKENPMLADEIGVLLAGIPKFSDNDPGGPAGTSPGASGGSSGVSGTNRAGGAQGGAQGGLVGAAGVSGPVVGQIVVLGTEQKYIDEMIRRIRQTQRGQS